MAAPEYIACTRMYNVCERVARSWDAVLETVSRLSGIRLRIERHAYPLDIQALWDRPDLGLVFVCGRAFALGGMRHKTIAVPLRERGADEEPAPLYGTHILVRKASSFMSCEDILDARIGWTVAHSHSGYLAVKRLLAPFAGKAVEDLFTAATGPLHTPMNCLNALRDNKADAVPLDSYCYSLLQRNAPETVAGARILASTVEYPMPFMAASEGVDGAVCEALRQALFETAELPAMADALRTLCITGFTAPETASYAALADPGESVFGA